MARSPGIGVAVGVLLAAAGAGAQDGTATVENGRFRQIVQLTCELEAVHKATVGSPRGLASRASFTIAEMAEEGALVAAGDVVLRFDSEDVHRTRVQKDTELVTARNDIEIKQLQAAAEDAERKAKIAEAEAKLEKASIDAAVEPGVTPRSKLQDAEHERDSARVELERQREALRAARREAESEIAILRIQEKSAADGLEQAESSLAAFEVTAPQAGIVVHQSDWNDRKTQVGDSVYGGNAVLTIQDLSAMRAVCELDQSDRHLVGAGQRVELRIDARPASVFGGTVEAISPVAESPGRGWWRRSSVRIFKAEVALERSDPELMKPGLTARADVLVRDEDGLIAPRAALRRDADGWYVRGASADRRAVEVLARNATSALLAGGVAAGNRVQVAP